MTIIITEQDIINTYDKRQQEQCRLYYGYQRIKKENPTYGYKRIAKLLGHSYGKTRWWHAKKHIPVPIQTLIWLKEKNLISLHIDHPQLPLIAKILGATFGDGGIFQNLNAIFLSSSELGAVKEFGEDLKIIFGKGIECNSRIIEGGEYGHSWCYQNTNRNIIRLFHALGAPIGKKSNIDIVVPAWIQNSPFIIKDEFFSSLFGGELGTPTIHKTQNRLTSLDIGMQVSLSQKEKAQKYLYQIADYLNEKGIKTGSIYSYLPDNLRVLLRLQISTEIENYYNFVKKIKLNYCQYKKVRLNDTLSKFIKIKKQKYQDLLTKGYQEERIIQLLRLSKNSLKFILNTKNNQRMEIRNRQR